MKTTVRLFVLTGLLALVAGSATAQTSMVPSAMNYQGLLTDDQGDPVAPITPENRNIEFRLYSDPTGPNVLWGEAQTVTVFKGNFSVILGNGTAIGVPSGPAAFVNVFANATSPDLYFGITPQGGAEFTPRQKVLSSAFALRARQAESVNALAQPAGQASQFNWLAASNMTVNGHSKVVGRNVLEFGVNDSSLTKNTAAGMIGYQTFSGGLDIVGAGPESGDRRITMWGEAGTEFKGPINFGSRVGQHINLWGSDYGLGIQGFTFYQRAPGSANFAWYLGGTHNDNPLNPGGGTTAATLNAGGFTLNAGKFTGDGSGLTNINPNSLPNNYNYLGINGGNVLEFGRGVNGKEVSAGKIGYGTFSGGNALDIVGAGTTGGNRRIQLWTEGGMNVNGPISAQNNLSIGGYTENFGTVYAKNGIVIEGSGGKLHFTTPNRLGQHINLYAQEYGIGIQPSTFYHRSGESYSWYVGGSHSDTRNDPGTGGGFIANWDNNRLDFYRRVYISGHLDVVGAENRNHSYAFYARSGNGGTLTGGAGGIYPVSIQAAHRVVGSEFNALSDARLKVGEGRSDSVRDLQTLAALEVTDYTMKDKFAVGDRKFKKLIAQQVEKIYPQVITSTTGNVPDIFRMATATKGFITLKEAQSFQLKKGETVRLLQGEREIFTEVSDVTAKGFAVKEAVEGELFVYGRKVNDLRTVDYEGVAMLNVSATQELYRQVQAQAAALEQVRHERNALAKEVAELRSSTSQQDKRLALLEAKLEAVAQRSSAPAPSPTKLGRK